MLVESREQNLGSVFFLLDDAGLNKRAETYTSTGSQDFLLTASFVSQDGLKKKEKKRKTPTKDAPNPNTYML